MKKIFAFLTLILSMFAFTSCATGHAEIDIEDKIMVREEYDYQRAASLLLGNEKIHYWYGYDLYEEKDSIYFIFEEDGKLYGAYAEESDHDEHTRNPKDDVRLYENGEIRINAYIGSSASYYVDENNSLIYINGTQSWCFRNLELRSSWDDIPQK